MLFVKIDESRNILEGPFSERILRDKIGVNVSLPEKIRDKDILAFGYACVEETPCELKQDKTTILSVEVVESDDPESEYIFTRRWFLSPYPGNIESRVARKWSEIRAKRDKLLAETDYRVASDVFYMRDQFVSYRKKLRDITKGVDDPFLVTFPQEPYDPSKGESFEGRKLFAVYKIEEWFNRIVNEVYPIDTGMGFEVLGGARNLTMFKTALQMGSFTIFDSLDVKRELSQAEMEQLVAELEHHYYGCFIQKKQWESDVASASEVSQVVSVLSQVTSAD